MTAIRPVSRADLPRFPLAALPTPLQRAKRLERLLHAPPIYVKRDDLTGFALAGNKARKLELIAADALERGCDVLVTGGGPGSNHCQATAAAARVAGLGCRLLLYGRKPRHEPANLWLARSFGADVRFTGEADRASVDRKLQEEATALRTKGGRPYVIPRGGATPLGAAAYALATRELARQLDEQGARPEVVVVATGSCGTQAGLVAGTAGGDHAWSVVGAAVSRPADECRRRVASLARASASLLGLPPPQARHIDVRDARGPGYGRPSPEGEEAALLAMSAEGLLLDPTFTAKAMATLVAMVRAGLEGPAVFVHTGGTASLFDRREAG